MNSSIRKKLFASHSVSILALLIVIVIVIFIELRYLQIQIPKANSVRIITSAAQQLTFHEENLLLNREESTLTQLRQSLKALQMLVDTNSTSEQNLINEDEAFILHEYLNAYSTTLDGIKNVSKENDDLLPLTRELRNINNDISNVIDEIESRHHQLLSKTADIVTHTMIIGAIFISAIALLSALFVTRLIVNPLHKLEKQLGDVANQKINKLSTVSKDSELVSFVSQFNTMLDKLRAQEHQLRHHEKAAALGILVSGVAHELNNPLSNISTSAQLLQEEDDSRPELRQQWLSHIDSEIERARKIVRRLLDSVRHQEQPLSELTAAKVVQNAVSLIHRQIDPGIVLDIEDIAETPIHVNHDRFQQIFINLIRNASDAGAKHIWVFGDKITRSDFGFNDLVCADKKTSFSPNIKEFFLFTIADDGSGIPEENIPNLFIPFFTTKTQGDGTGLGLYLVNEIVTEHDGCISVRNREDKGCEFLILLPLDKDA